MTEQASRTQVLDDMSLFVESEWGRAEFVDCSTSLHPDSIVWSVPHAQMYIKAPLNDALAPTDELAALQAFRAAGVSVPDAWVVHARSTELLVSRRLEGEPLTLAADERDLRDLSETMRRYLEVSFAGWGRRDGLTVGLTGVPEHWARTTALALEPVSDRMGISRRNLSTALSRCEELLSASEQPVLSHGDLKPEHCFRTRSGIGLIDFGQSGGGWYGEDLGSWVAEVDWLTATQLGRLIGLSGPQDVAARAIIKLTPFLVWGIRSNDWKHVDRFCSALRPAFSEL